MTGPTTIAPELKKALEELERYRFPIHNQDRSAVFREWLEKQEAVPPKCIAQPERSDRREEP